MRIRGLRKLDEPSPGARRDSLTWRSIAIVAALLGTALARAQSTAPPLPESAAVVAARTELARIADGARDELARLERQARERNAGELSRSESAQCVVQSRAAALARIDELLLSTTAPDARVQVWLAYLGYPDERPVRESLQSAYAIAPAGRVRATVAWAMADEIWVDEPERGFTLLSRAVEEDPLWSAARVQRAWISADAGRWPSVFADLDRALELAPGDAPELGILRARFELRRAGFDEALAAAQAERVRLDAPRERVVRATLLAATALHALNSPVEARVALRSVSADCDEHWRVLDFLPSALVAPVTASVGELREEARRAEERARPAKDGPKRTLGIVPETDAERQAREAEELRVAELARAKARAEREAQRRASATVDVACDACGASGVVSVRCPHCSGSGRELYKTRKRTEREQQGAYWVVRTIEERVPCMTCDGVGLVGQRCGDCQGRCVLTVPAAQR